MSTSLFQCIRTQMVNAALQTGQRCEDFPNPRGWLCDEDQDLNGANRLTVASLELPNLKSQASNLMIKEKTPEVMREIYSVIEHTQVVDQRLENWVKSLPEIWKGETPKIVVEEPSDPLSEFFWTGPVYVYQDLNIANVMNEYRVLRLSCQSIILDCIDSIPNQLLSEQLEIAQRKALYLVQKMIDDICSTVPFLLGFDIINRRWVKSISDETAEKSTGGFYAATPLFIARKYMFIPSKQRQWLLGRLYHIGRELGLSEDRIGPSHDGRGVPIPGVPFKPFPTMHSIAV